VTTPSPQLPFDVRFDADRGQLELTMTFGVPPQQKTRTCAIPTLEQAAVEIAPHRHESRLQQLLVQALINAAILHLKTDPRRLEEAVLALSDPSSLPAMGRVRRVHVHLRVAWVSGPVGDPNPGASADTGPSPGRRCRRPASPVRDLTHRQSQNTRRDACPRRPARQALSVIATMFNRVPPIRRGNPTA
jgi:hypothetical protein